MRKIITLDSMSDIPQEEAIYVFLSPRGLSKVVSTENIHIMDDGKVTPIGTSRWAIRAIGMMSNRIQFGILHPDDISKDKLFYSRSLTKDDFISKLKEWYPDDLEFFLWHPEVLKGKWNKE